MHAQHMMLPCEIICAGMSKWPVRKVARGAESCACWRKERKEWDNKLAHWPVHWLHGYGKNVRVQDFAHRHVQGHRPAGSQPHFRKDSDGGIHHLFVEMSIQCIAECVPFGTVASASQPINRTLRSCMLIYRVAASSVSGTQLE